MKVYEYLTQVGQDSLLHYITIAGMAAQTAKSLKDMDEGALAEPYLDVVQYVTKILTDEAKIRDEGRDPSVLRHLSQAPVTIYQLVKQHPELLDPSLKRPKLKLFRQLMKLVANGQAVRVSERKFALPPPTAPEIPKEALN